MPITIGANISSIRAQLRLGRTTEELSRTYERLSSGARINRASDDPAGLALGMALNIQARIANQALRNINDGISGFSIVEGALTELGGILQRQMELAEQAANGTFSSKQRQALDDELQALTREYNRIIESTEFNGTFNLSGTSNISIQVGLGSIDLSMPGLVRIAQGATGDGTFAAAHSFSTLGSTSFGTADSVADFNNDGYVDVAVPDATGNLSVLLNNGDGSFRSAQLFATDVDSTATATGDFNGDGKMDIVTMNSNSHDISVLNGNGDGTFLAARSFAAATGGVAIRAGDLNGDGKLDLVAADATGAGGSGAIRVFLGDGAGNFASSTTYNGAASSADGMVLVDVNGDNKLDAITVSMSGNYIGIFLGNGDGSFRARTSIANSGGPTNLTYADVNGDGKSDLITADYTSNSLSVFIGNGDGTFRARASYATGGQTYYVSAADLDGDGISDILSVNRNQSTVRVYLANSDGTLKAPSSMATSGATTSVLPVDFNNDGAYDIFAFDNGGASIDIFLGNSNGSGSAFNILTQSAARSALTTIQSYFSTISGALDKVGSAQSRLQVAMAVTQASEISYRNAQGRITDADIASESASLVKLQILQQAQAAVLAQASSDQKMVLDLLR